MTGVGGERVTFRVNAPSVSHHPWIVGRPGSRRRGALEAQVGSHCGGEQLDGAFQSRSPSRLMVSSRLCSANAGHDRSAPRRGLAAVAEDPTSTSGLLFAETLAWRWT